MGSLEWDTWENSEAAKFEGIIAENYSDVKENHESTKINWDPNTKNLKNPYLDAEVQLQNFRN